MEAYLILKKFLKIKHAVKSVLHFVLIIAGQLFWRMILNWYLSGVFSYLQSEREKMLFLHPNNWPTISACPTIGNCNFESLIYVGSSRSLVRYKVTFLYVNLLGDYMQQLVTSTHSGQELRSSHWALAHCTYPIATDLHSQSY